MSTQRKLTLCLAWLLAIAFGSTLLLPIASSHADYERSEPAADAVVTAAPPQVRIWFTQELFRREGLNQIEVLDATGQRVDQEDVTIDDDDRTLMQVSLASDLPQGVYTVRWQSLSAEDGHEGKGEFIFTVGDAAAQTAATPTATPAPTTTVAPPPGPTVPPPASALPCLGGAAPLLMAIGALLTRRRN